MYLRFIRNIYSVKYIIIIMMNFLSLGTISIKGVEAQIYIHSIGRYC